jgi:hypothetical protein
VVTWCFKTLNVCRLSFSFCFVKKEARVVSLMKLGGIPFDYILALFQGIRRPRFAYFFFDQDLFKIYKKYLYKISIIKKYVSIQIQ